MIQRTLMPVDPATGRTRAGCCVPTGCSPSFGAMFHNCHSHRIPLPWTVFEFTLDAVFVPAVTTDSPRRSTGGASSWLDM